VEAFERLPEGLHRDSRIRPYFHEAIAQAGEVTELGCGHGGELRFVFDCRSQRSVGGESLEGHELAVGQHAEEVDDGGAVVRVIRERVTVYRCHGRRLVPAGYHEFIA
jgi:hypothetical protein